MPKSSKKRIIKWAIAGAVVAVVAFLGFRYWKSKQSTLPEGIAWGNGRLEGRLVDVAAKEPLRVKEVLVDEGAVVKPGDVVVRLDTITLESQLDEAKASVVLAQERLAFAKATIEKQKSEVKLARRRGRPLPTPRRRRRRLAARARRPQDAGGDDERHARRGRGDAWRPRSATSRSRRRTSRRSRRASTTRRSARRSPAACSIASPRPVRSSRPAAKRSRS